ncbi:MAG: HEAT repeat domain-containing protein [Alphaproteobacteria bacterium]|nr:HEAT repeat domain-containing protein [Alphaproteobacteria bacterium]
MHASDLDGHLAALLDAVFTHGLEADDMTTPLLSLGRFPAGSVVARARALFPADSLGTATLLVVMSHYAHRAGEPTVATCLDHAQAVLEGPGEPWVRGEALRTVALLDTHAGHRCGRAWCRSPLPELRAAAAWALGSGGVEDGDLASLLALADDPMPRVREQAAIALNGVEDPRAVASLESLLDDGDVDVRVRAIESLAAMGDVRADAIRRVVEGGCLPESLLLVAEAARLVDLLPLFEAWPEGEGDSLRRQVIGSLRAAQARR